MLLIDYWKPIKGYEGLYSVSYCGDVRSWDRYIKNWPNGVRLWKGRKLKFFWNCKGYLLVKLCENGKQLTKKVHRLVAKTFVLNPNSYPQVNHNITPTKTINCVPNLEWCNNSINIRHAHKAGLINNKKGENHPKSKLTNKKVINIKKLLNQGYTQSSIAQKYNINTHVVSDIKTEKSWKHICL